MKNDVKEKYKTFISAVLSIRGDTRKTTKSFSDKRMTFLEKKILKALLSVKKGSYQEGLELLKDLETSNQYFKAHRDLVLAHCHNNRGDFETALQFYLSASKTFEEFEDKTFLFSALLSATTVYGNLKRPEQMEELLEKISPAELKKDGEKVSFYKCLAHYELLSENPKKAIQLVNKCLTKYKDGAEKRESFLFTIKLMALFQQGEKEKFFTELEKYKKLTGFRIKENYKYMKSLADFIFNNSPLYIYEKDFKNTKVLFYELSTIKALATGELDEAKLHWENLQKINKSLYLSNFKLDDKNSLFAKALSKANSFTGNLSTTIDTTELERFETIQEKLTYIFNEKEIKLSREELIKLLWNEELTQKNLVRLSAQITRLRNKSHFKIAVKNGFYFKDAA